MYVLYIVEYSFSWFHGLTNFRYLLLCSVVVVDSKGDPVLKFRSIFTLYGLNVSVCGCILLDFVSFLVGFGFHISDFVTCASCIFCA